MTYKITIPAVKISPGSTPPSLPLLPDVDSLLSPDACRSNSGSNVIALEPLETPAIVVPVGVATLTDEENEVEFGEFLLDAVDWL
jgi:hypothetical protein